jgi:2-oxoglutarate dehydrogenase E2 component (dihydrolipoamide succinyltransferase)
MIVEVLVPKYGAASSKVEVAEWYKKEGEKVKKDEPLVLVETEKVTTEIKAPKAGTLRNIKAREGESIEAGKIIVEIETEE